MHPIQIHRPGPFLRRGLAVLVLLVSGALIAAGCGGSGNGGSNAAPKEPAPSAGSGATTKSTIQNFAFHPNQIDVKVGQKVTWTNDDTAPHTVTANNGAFDSKNIDQGGSYTFTFAKAGTFAYHCTIHQNMKGTVVVSS